MELITWSDQYATGISGIDSEHRELINEINSFYAKLADQSDNKTLVNILNDIYGTIHAHFMLEERLMERHGYDEYEAHKHDHARLLDDIRDIAMELEKSSDFDEQQLKTKLSDWFLMHFKTYDSRLHKLEQLISGHNKVNRGFNTWLRRLKAKFITKR